ncbi:MAG: fibrillarin-like rRNA/tRNA 2'-O-methyltransferase, partial [Promethearchaeota archaeon]
MNKLEIRKHPYFSNVFVSGFSKNIKLFTKNLVPGNRVYGEKLVYFNGVEYREWDPYRSKLAALIINEPKTNFLSKNFNCLYLGAASGTTISHLSDIVNNNGIIYGIEFAERSIRELIQNMRNRKNVISILGDARYAETYANSIFSEINLIYQDVAQPNQARIAINNSNYYLK